VKRRLVGAVSTKGEESPLLEAVTRKRVVKENKTLCAVVTAIFGVCNSVRLL
jgi:hypothetical protein